MTIESEQIGMQYVLKDIRCNYLDSDVSVMEINFVLNKLKDNEAPGVERLHLIF